MSPVPERLHAIILGYVQGVNFRYYTRLRAQQLGLRGWVRNLPDGSVETAAEGPAAALQELQAWLRHGPPTAQVTEVRADWGPASGEFFSFEVQW